MDCVDLKATFGKRYKVGWDEAYRAEYGKGARTNDPWLRIVPCKYGHIYPYGGRQLVASMDKRGRLASRLASLGCVRVFRDADDGVDVLFDVGDFDRVAEVMKPRKRRRMSDAEKARLVAAGKATRKTAIVGHLARPGRTQEGSGHAE
jgi:hypothetical protein